MAYVFARARTKKSTDVVFTDEVGKLFVRKGGSRAWRNNNPGNLRHYAFAQQQGAIGEAGGFAVFADLGAGRSALKALLRTASYAKLSIEDAVKRYALPSENSSDAYARNLKKITGLDIATKLADLQDAQLDAVVKAIETLEGTIPGTEQPMAKVVGVVTERGRIVAYQLDDGPGTVERSRALSLAGDGLLDAVVVHGKGGPYLRTRPDLILANNLLPLAHAA
jgi:hypothetical protein